MHVLISGGTGFIGSALVPRLESGGHQVTVLTRQRLKDTRTTRYVRSLSDIGSTPVDAVVNLAGASLAGRRWTQAYKQVIRDSRIQTTRKLVSWVQSARHKPQVFLSASAIGFYGPQGDHFLTEAAASTPSFSSILCRDWEAAAGGAEKAGVRTCFLRLGVVLDTEGGAYADMSRPFRFGMANWMGHGDQWLSWVHRSDVIAAILYLLEQPCLSGPFNITAPEPVTSRGFCDVMRQHYRTLAALPVPAPVLRLMLGEMAEELLLTGQRVVPAALREAGFSFAFDNLGAAVADIRARE